MIPITVVEFGAEEERLVLEVIRSGQLAQGKLVAQLEVAFAELVGVKHAIAVNNGTTSLIASLAVLDLRPGDEVLTSPFTFIATLNSILDAGATATFADISPADFNVTGESLEAAITERTRVLMPVHLYGQIADMDAISDVADRHGLAIVEDAAQSHGSMQNSRSAGSYGLGSFSFYATKNITTGEGGIITTDDDDMADRLRILRNQGMRSRYDYVTVGNNYRLTELQAALGLPQIARYRATVSARQANARVLAEALRTVPGIVVPRELPGRSHVWHQFTIRVTPEAGIDRDEFVAKLSERGIGCGVYYPKLVFDYPPYRDRRDVVGGHFPIAEQVVREVVSLPIHPHLTTDDLETIAAAVRNVVTRA